MKKKKKQEKKKDEEIRQSWDRGKRNVEICIADEGTVRYIKSEGQKIGGKCIWIRAGLGYKAGEHETKKIIAQRGTNKQHNKQTKQKITRNNKKNKEKITKNKEKIQKKEGKKSGMIGFSRNTSGKKK